MKSMALFYKILSILIFMLIILISYHFKLHSQYSTYRDAHLASRDLKQQLAMLKQDEAKKDTYFSQFSLTLNEYNQQMVVFPSGKDINAALETVKAAGEKSQLQFQTLTPGTPVQKSFYIEVPVQINLIGSYQQILNFMQTTASWTGPLFIWKNWTLSHRARPETTVLNETQNNDLLQMHVDAIFFYKS